MKAEHIFKAGVRKVLHRLKKQRVIVSFKKISDQVYTIVTRSNTSRMIIIFSEHYQQDILPKGLLESEGWMENYSQFMIGFGAGFESASIKKIERIIRKRFSAIEKGLLLEKKFADDGEEFLRNNHKTYGLLSITKTTVVQEKSRMGDFILSFEDGYNICVDIKSSDYAVHLFHSRDNIKAIAFNYSNCSFEDFLQNIVEKKRMMKKQKALLSAVY